MRGRRCSGGLIGCLLIIIGVIILFAMVLPPGFWWFVFGVALICGGFYCANRH